VRSPERGRSPRLRLRLQPAPVTWFKLYPLTPELALFSEVFSVFDDQMLIHEAVQQAY
jgi:hypothetical protein